MTDLTAVLAAQNAAIPLGAYTHAELEKDLTTLAENIRPVFIVAEQDGQIVGAANYHRFAGAYHPNKFGADLFVHPQYQNRGIGTALFTTLLEKLAPLEPISLTIQARQSEPHAVAFANKYGFREIKRLFESLLDLSTYSSQPYSLPDGVELVSWQDTDSLERRQELHQVFELVRLDMPRSEAPTRITFEFFNENIVADSETLLELSFYALQHNQIIGFTGCFKGAHDGWIDQWVTATTAAARGQGIATALKKKQIELAQQAGFSTIRTDNDTRNAAMLAINDKLGFVRQAALLVMKKEFLNEGVFE